MADLLGSVRVLELAGSLDAAVAGRALADAAADVMVLDIDLGQPPDEESRARAVLDLPKREASPEPGEDAASAAVRLAAESDVIVLGGHADAIEALGLLDRLAEANPAAVLVAITPFGLEGPRSRWRGSDLVTFHASSLARILQGPVEDPEADPPVRAAGQQSSFIAGLTAALAATFAIEGRAGSGGGPAGGTRIDISAQEALAAMAARELAMPAFGGVPSRTRKPGQIGATYTIPASDGWVAISPREPHQWRAWVEVLGNPPWAHEPEFAERAKRLQLGDRLIANIAPWSSQRARAELFALAQAAHVPCFPVNEPADVLREPQFEARGSFEVAEIAEAPGAGPVRVPARPYRVRPTADVPEDRRRSRATSRGGLPLEGIRVLDFSWVIAGPTTTRFLAAMGAEVIKVESPVRPDPGRGSELHAALGQSKRSLALDLKAPGAIEAVRRLVAECDVVVENFAAGVMERLGLGYDALLEERPDLVMLSASGVGRTGPLGDSVAYGTLLQAFTGFTALNGNPGRPPVTGFAWADPLSALVMTTAITAALHARRRTGRGCHIDFSMSDALLWTLPGIILGCQAADGAERTGDLERLGNRSQRFAPHGLYRAAGEDEWLAIAVTDDAAWRALCGQVAPLAGLERLGEAERLARREELDGALGGWARERDAHATAEALQAAGVPAAASLHTLHLFEDAHLAERGFYALSGEGEHVLRLPALPWRWPGLTPHLERAPDLGADGEAVLASVAGLGEGELAALRASGAFG